MVAMIKKFVLFSICYFIFTGCAIHRFGRSASAPAPELKSEKAKNNVNSKDPLNSSARSGGFLKAASCQYSPSNGKSADVCVEVRSRNSIVLSVHKKECAKRGARFVYNVCQSSKAQFLCSYSKKKNGSSWQELMYIESKLTIQAKEEAERQCRAMRGDLVVL